MSHNQELISQTYAVELENREPDNYTRIPNILSDLTYDHINPKTKKKEIKRLSIYAKELYRVLKLTAGEHGVSWKSTATLAKECNMSMGSITNAKKELMQSFHQLNGMPLIKIEAKKKSFNKEQKCAGKTEYHLIKILDIWGLNRAYSTLKKQKKEEALSPNESADQALSPNESAQEEALSPHERNKNTSNNLSLFKEQHHTAEADPAVFLDKSKKLLPSDPKIRALNWFLSEGCPEKSAKMFLQKYSVDDIKSASHYMKKPWEKSKQTGEVIDNFWGYFHKVLKNRYWEKK